MLRRSLFTALPAMAAICLSMLQATPAMAQDATSGLVRPGVLTVGTTGSSSPSTMIDTGGNLIGYDIDFARRVGASLGVPVEFVRLDFSAMLPGLIANRFDMVASSVSRSPQRIAATDFIMSAPYLVNGIALTKRRGDTRINGWRDICGLRAGAVRGAVEIGAARQQLGEACVLPAREYPGWTELLLDLENRRIDYLIGNFLTPTYLVSQGRTGIEVLSEPLSITTSGVVINRNERALADRVNALIAEWRADGSLKEMTDKWFGASLDWSLVRE
ncbi:substrate-binding periplasmic protein [Humitalea sp. 24SJ18S-53]|uniref:substrate-binding periplasmic protein n=1 Tax=Humitalea sp. 24SJ18S-53 TaxID=3422307 RepID=UPI003D674B31